ncbi:hypothetical protein SEA_CHARGERPOWER_81 [Mycobacterium phage Chargerpower]|nr:hypothetical protein SEA_CHARGERPOWER_81 [Mycobacterium phage Chargerpower]
MYGDEDKVAVFVAGELYYVMPATADVIERIIADDERGETYTRV